MEPTEYTAVSSFADSINAELDRLGIDTDADPDVAPCSGVMVEDVPGSEAAVRVGTDRASGEYYADQLLMILEDTDAATLDPDEDENIWEIIRPAAI